MARAATLDVNVLERQLVYREGRSICMALCDMPRAVMYRATNASLCCTG